MNVSKNASLIIVSCRQCGFIRKGRLMLKNNERLCILLAQSIISFLEHKDDIRFLTAILFVTIISTIIIPVATPFMTHTKPIAAFELVFFIRAVYLKKIFRKIMRLHM